MILSKLIVYSYQTNEVLKEYSFNTVGLNIIIGEKKEKGQETNGVGKTTMIESINFILGGSCPKDFINKPELTKRDLLIVLRILDGNKENYLARLINQPEKGYILTDSSIDYRLQNWIDKDEEEYKKYINDVIVGLRENEPLFSSLREYIIRDEKAGFIGLGLPDRTAMYESMYLAFLFGLPHDFEKIISVLKKEHKQYNQKIKLINSLKSEISDLKLRERKLNAEIKKTDSIIKNIDLSKKFADDAKNYQINKSEYNKIQNYIFELNHIRKQYEINIHDLQEKLKEIQAMNDIEPFYEQLIGFFPDRIKKNQIEIQQFYNFMVENRGKYFSHKIAEIDHEIEQNQRKIEQLNRDMKRQSKSFKNSDIIADLTKINEDKNIMYEELAQIRVKIDLYQQKTSVTAEINKIKSEILRQIDMKLDLYNTYESEIKEIKELFNTLVTEAYDETGVFDIELVNDTALNKTTGRIKINCTIDDEKSHGRLHMKINMFDLTWLIHGLKKRDTLTFLIHDGSYSKPNGLAKFKLLKYVDEFLKELGKGQYFITVNDNEFDETEMKKLHEINAVVAKLIRTEDNKERFFGFRYTS